MLSAKYVPLPKILPNKEQRVELSDGRLVFGLPYLSWYPRTGGQNCCWQWRQRPRKTELRVAMCIRFWVQCRALRAMAFAHYESYHPRLAVSAHRCICSLPRNSTHTLQSTESVHPNTAHPTNVTVRKPMQETQSTSPTCLCTDNKKLDVVVRLSMHSKANTHTQSQNQKWLGWSVLV